MEYKLETTKQFVKAYKNCKDSGFDMGLLDDWVKIISSRELTPEEVQQTQNHKINKDKYYPKNCYALHVTGPKSNWELVYQKLDNGTVRLIKLLNTGLHNKIYKSKY